MIRTLVLARAFLRIFSRDRQSIFFTLFFPVTFMVIFGFATPKDGDPLSIGVVDQAGNAFSGRFVEALADNALFDVTVGEKSDLRRRVIDGDMTLVLVVPPDVRGDQQPVELEMLVDAAQARQTAMVTPMVEQALLRVERELRGSVALFSLDVVDVKARSQRYIDFLVPGLLALTIMQISVAGSGYNIVEYRRKGILKRLFVTPISPANFIGGIVIARLAITVIQVSFLLAMAVALLHVQVAGNLFELLIPVLLGSAIFLSLGFCMGSVAKTQQAIMLLGNLITLPQIFLSGIFFPIDSIPEMLQPIARLLPLSFLAQVVREVIVNGASLLTQVPAVTGLLAWLAIALVLAIRMFRWKEVAA